MMQWKINAELFTFIHEHAMLSDSASIAVLLCIIYNAQWCIAGLLSTVIDNKNNCLFLDAMVICRLKMTRDLWSFSALFIEKYTLRIARSSRNMCHDKLLFRLFAHYEYETNAYSSLVTAL